MRMGTRSVLFGVHAFWLHGWFVLRAWYMVNKRHPSLVELCAIFTHDLGYWGCPSMDGDIGETHPQRVSNLWVKHCGKFGKKVARVILGHSGYYCARYNMPYSDLYYPDKLATGLYPARLYLVLAVLSGELWEYIWHCRFGKFRSSVVEVEDKNALQWVMVIQANCVLRALANGSGVDLCLRN